ncbi:MAG: hypothetical protein CME65_13465 [Halobacteriovoraceae bacterium]|nr:hypothetical protein [Halobacteriovoraceae bacterium]|tara:strand:+ start:3995 stop:5413 length:1419 start_codon:yes stop_codon:yes gene_type:complete
MQQTLQTLLLVLAAVQVGDIVIASILYFIYGRRVEYLLVILMWLGMLLMFIMDGILGSDSSIYHIYFSYIFSGMTGITFGEILKRLYGIKYSWLLYFLVALICYALSLGLALIGNGAFVFLAALVSAGITLPVFVSVYRVIKTQKNLQFLDKFFLSVIFLWGVHFLDYPYLRPDTNISLSIFGFALALFLTYLSSVLIPVILNRHIYNQFTLDLEKQLKDQKLKLKFAQEQIIARENLANLGALSAGIAHEIKNPINIILNSSQVLSNFIEKKELQDGQIKDVVEMIQRNADRADNTIKGILSQSSAGSGKLQELNLSDVLKSSYDLVCSTYKEVSIKAIFNFSHTPKFFGFEGELLRCFINIYENSFQALMEKKDKVGEFSMMIETSTYYRDDFLEVVIKDNGVGINESLKDEVFKPFFTTKPSGEGTGLGLSMVIDIVKYHNGNIVVDSQDGEFTSIHIKLYGKLEEDER